MSQADVDSVLLRIRFNNGRTFLDLWVKSDPPPSPEFDVRGNLVGYSYIRADNLPDVGWVNWAAVDYVEVLSPERRAVGVARRKPKDDKSIDRRKRIETLLTENPPAARQATENLSAFVRLLKDQVPEFATVSDRTLRADTSAVLESLEKAG